MLGLLGSDRSEAASSVQAGVSLCHVPLAFSVCPFGLCGCLSVCPLPPLPAASMSTSVLFSCSFSSFSNERTPKMEGSCGLHGGSPSSPALPPLTPSCAPCPSSPALPPVPPSCAPMPCCPDLSSGSLSALPVCPQLPLPRPTSISLPSLSQSGLLLPDLQGPGGLPSGQHCAGFPEVFHEGLII